MKVSGLQLYILYTEAQLEVSNCGVEEWDEMPQSERDVYDYMAEKINNKEWP